MRIKVVSRFELPLRFNDEEWRCGACGETGWIQLREEWISACPGCGGRACFATMKGIRVRSAVERTARSIVERDREKRRRCAKLRA